MIKHCLICNKPFYVKPCNKDKNKFCSHLCYWTSKKLGYYPQAGFPKNHGCFTTPEGRKRQSVKISGEKHWAWKGKNVGIKALHSWVRRQKGKPKFCQECKAIIKERIIDWCNINHQYERNLKDFKSWCRSCHRKYDIKHNNYRIAFIKNMP